MSIIGILKKKKKSGIFLYILVFLELLYYILNIEGLLQTTGSLRGFFIFIFLYLFFIYIKMTGVSFMTLR
jgi:hypothetical protein